MTAANLLNGLCMLLIWMAGIILGIILRDIHYMKIDRKRIKLDIERLEQMQKQIDLLPK